MARLALFLFGSPQIKLNETPLKLNRHKATALLAYLAIHPERHSRNTLATLLWPNQDQTRARAALRRILVTLKKAGLEPWLEANRETIGLVSTTSLWIDVLQFRQHLADCLAASGDPDTVCVPLLTDAVTLYRGDFMAGFTLRDSPDFDEWQRLQTENLRHDQTSALARLVRCYRNQGDYEAAIGFARRWLTLDPLYELAHRQLMELYIWNGQRSAALQQYQACLYLLEEELGVPPSEETIALHRRIQQGLEIEEVDKPRMLSLPSDSASQTPTLHNFPTQPTPFLGRRPELTEIAQRLNNADCRLLTLLGPGGIGKTRLAIQAAREQAANFPHGLYFVSLASVSSVDFLPSTLADALNLPLDGQEDIAPQLFNYLRHKQLLLVLDNFEHLVRKVGLVAELLSEAPHIKVLVTSRERLNLQGEWTVDIKGMHYPTSTDVDSVEGYGAVALFLHRAYRVHSSFALTEADKPHIVRICQLMTGVPLAIELAASWIRLLSCAEIAAEIEQMYQHQDNLDFLSTTLHDVPQRHQNLRSVFDHSWQLLSVEEKRVLRKLSVFQGGCQRDAIERVIEANLALISALVDKSLLTRSASGRYEMHVMLRQFVAEKLHQNQAEAEATQDRHCTYYTSFLHQRETELRGTAQKEILAEIAVEIENIRAAWRWAIIHGKTREIEQALESLSYFYAMYSWFQEGVETFGRAAATLKKRAQQDVADGEQLSRLQGQILAQLGWFFLRQGFYDQARDLLQESIDIFQRLNEQEQIATPRHFLGILANQVGELAEARAQLQASLEIYRKNNNPWGMAWTLSNLAYTSATDEDEFFEATKLIQESLAIYKAIGNKQGIAIALNNLGYILYRQGDYSTAKQLITESLSLRREIGFPRGIAVGLNNLGHVTAALKEYDICKSCYYEALQLATTIEAVPLTLGALGGLAIPYHSQGKIERALTLLNLVLQHPASTKETKERAMDDLDRLKLGLLPGANSIPMTIETYTETYEKIIKEILAEIQPIKKETTT